MPSGSNSPIDLPNTDLLTVAEVAKLLRVSKMTVYRMVENKEIRSIRIGVRRGVIRIPRDAYDDYMDASHE